MPPHRRQPNNKLEIVEFESWMKRGFAELKSSEYGDSVEESTNNIEQRLLHKAVYDKSIVLVALDGEAVVGTQTYTYWPYQNGSTTYHSLQSGMTLVHKNYRGRGLFTKMLRRGNEVLESRGADFITGFPVPMSFGGFIKDNWKHVGSLRWFIRPIKPFRMVRRDTQMSRSTTPKQVAGIAASHIASIVGSRRPFSSNKIQLTTERSFLDYRYAKSTNHEVLHREEEQDSVTIPFKQSRKHGFEELIVGDILINGKAGARMVRSTLKHLINARKADIDAVTVLVNPRNLPLVSTLLSLRFLPLKKTVPFILKGIKSGETTAANSGWSNWDLYNADIDTW